MRKSEKSPNRALPACQLRVTDKLTALANQDVAGAGDALLERLPTARPIVKTSLLAARLLMRPLLTLLLRQPNLLRALLAAILLVCVSCDRAAIPLPWNGLCQSVGVCESPPVLPVAIDFVCDHSRGSSCIRENLVPVLDQAARAVADKPNSLLRLWVIGKDTGETRSLAEQRVPEPRRGSERSRKAQREHAAAALGAVLQAAAEQIFAEKAARRSPIAEAIAKVALAETGKRPRTIILLTDAREVSQFGDFECRRIPSGQQFGNLLRANSILNPDTLTDTAFEFAFVQSSAIPNRGCAVQLGREIKIRTVWEHVLRAAGASRVRFSQDLPNLDELQAETTKGDQHD